MLTNLPNSMPSPCLYYEVIAMRIIKVILIIAGAVISVGFLSATIALQMLGEWMRDNKY